MAEWTHLVCCGDMGCQLELRDIATSSYDIEYQSSPFKRLIWRHRKIGCTCMLYASGKAICHGSKDQFRKYARLLQKMGYSIKLRKIKIITRSAVYKLSNEVDYKKITSYASVVHEPELYHAIAFIKEGIHYIVYKSGKVIVTGIKTEKELDEKVNPTLLELEIL